MLYDRMTKHSKTLKNFSELEWYRPGELTLPPEARLDLEDLGRRLTITPAFKQDEGVYFCSATLDGVTKSDKAVLKIEGKKLNFSRLRIFVELPEPDPEVASYAR